MKEKFFSNPSLRAVINILVPIIFSVTSAIALQTDLRWLSYVLWILSGLLVLFLIYFVVECTKYDKKQKDQSNSYEEIIENQKQDFRNINIKFQALSETYKDLNTIVHDNSDTLYKIIDNKKDHSEIINWTEMKTNCDAICRLLYRLLKGLSAQGDKFSVSLILRRKHKNDIQYNMISRESYTKHYPKMYNTFKSQDDFRNYHFKALFDRNISRPNYLPTKDAIQAAFFNCDGVEYSQYIGIPINCTGNKMIGILQIISYEDSLIAKNKAEMEKLYNEYFCLFSNLILLADKIENIEQLID